MRRAAVRRHLQGRWQGPAEPERAPPHPRPHRHHNRRGHLPEQTISLRGQSETRLCFLNMPTCMLLIFIILLFLQLETIGRNNVVSSIFILFVCVKLF